MANAKALNGRKLNNQDFFNECILSLSLYWKMLFTNLIESQEDQYFFAKIEISLILLYCFVNIVIIVQAIV